jgi:hypothetical protein
MMRATLRAYNGFVWHGRFNPVDVSAPIRPVIQARGGSIFAVLRGVGLLLAMFAVLFLGGAAAVNDSAGETGGLIFLVASASLVALAFIAGRNVKLFANEDVVGIVGPLGGVRVCPRSELGEIRTRWHWYQGRGMGSWVFPTLHFRKRDTRDAFMTPVLLYRGEELLALGAYLGMPIDLDRPTTPRAA